MKLRTLVLCLSALLPGLIQAQSILNGSFESNGASCIYNIPNATYTANMANSTGFGVASQLDIISTSCGYGAAQSGSWYVAMAVDISNTQNDAFSLTLSAPLTTGNAYTLRWYDRGWAPYATNVLQVGLSTTNNSFGTLIYTAPLPTINTWVSRSVTFNAPNNGQFITARVVVGSYGWTHVDNFSLSIPVPVETLTFYGQGFEAGTDSLYWMAENEQAIASYELQMLTQGDEFVTVGSMPAHGGGKYRTAHTGTAPYPRHYRLQINELDGARIFSDVVEIGEAGMAGQDAWEVYPNPSNGVFSVRFPENAPSEAMGTVSVIDMNGKTVWSQAATTLMRIDLQDIPAGLYMVQWAGRSGTKGKRIAVE